MEPSCLAAGLLKRHGEDVREVALLTPYRAQLGVLRRAAQRELDEKALLTVTFATVDGFQVHKTFPDWGMGFRAEHASAIQLLWHDWSRKLSAHRACQLGHAHPAIIAC